MTELKLYDSISMLAKKDDLSEDEIRNFIPRWKAKFLDKRRTKIYQKVKLSKLSTFRLVISLWAWTWPIIILAVVAYFATFSALLLTCVFGPLQLFVILIQAILLFEQVCIASIVSLEQDLV